MYQPIRKQSLTVGENSDTSMEARDLKINAELSGDIHSVFLT